MSAPRGALRSRLGRPGGRRWGNRLATQRAECQAADWADDRLVGDHERRDGCQQQREHADQDDAQRQANGTVHQRKWTEDQSIRRVLAIQ